MIDDSYANDPEPPICRHRAGDPECTCSPEPDDDELSDPEADLLADVETRNKWAREAIAALPAVPPDIRDDEVRILIEQTRAAVEDIIHAMRSDFDPQKGA